MLTNEIGAADDHFTDAVSSADEIGLEKEFLFPKILFHS